MRDHRFSLFCSVLALTLSTALPAYAAGACGPLQIIATLPMTPVGNAAVVTVPVLIGDTQEKLLVDTGGVLSSLTKRTVRELNLPTTQSDTGLKNVRGQVTALRVKLPSITLGAIRQDGPYFSVLPGDDNPADTRPAAFAGDIALDMLQKVDADFDFGGSKLNLISQNHCDGMVQYWPSPVVAIIPFQIDSDLHIRFPVKLNGERLSAMLDTGATNTNLDLDFARSRFAVDTNAADVEKVGELTAGRNIYRRRFDTLSFEGVSVGNPMVTLMPNLFGPPRAPDTGSLIHEDIDSQPQVTIGMAVIDKLHLYIAFKERKLYITQATPQAAP